MDEDDQFGIYAEDDTGRRTTLALLIAGFCVAATTGIWLVGRGRGWW
jgi:hypothetical protein